MARQCGLGDVDGPVHHLKTAHFGQSGCVAAVIALRHGGLDLGVFRPGVLVRGPGAEAVQHRPRRPVQQRPGGRGVEYRGGGAHHAVQPLGGDTGLAFSAGAAFAAVEAHRDGQVGVDSGDRCHGQRIQDAAVGEQTAVDLMGGDDSRDGDGSVNGFVERSALKPDRFARQNVGRHRRVGDRQLFDGDRSEDVAYGVQNLLGSQHPRRGDRRIEQPQNGALIQGLGPVAELPEAPGRLQSADHGAHRRTGDPGDLIAPLAQRLDHPDVRIAARAAAAERQGHPGRR